MDKIQEKAKKYAKLKLGADYNTKIYPDSNVYTFGTFSEEDYIAGYKEAINSINWISIYENLENNNNLSYFYAEGKTLDILSLIQEQIKKQLK